MFPILAIVENPNPPSYEAVANDDDNEAATAAADADAADAAAPAAHPAAITSSLRRTYHVLYADGGWRSLFRGLVLAFVISVVVSVCTAVFSALPFVPSVLGWLLASLALVQLHTAWVHTVICSGPAKSAFWHDLPPFRRTLEATGLPVCASWLAKVVTATVPYYLGRLMGLPTWDFRSPTTVPALDGHMVWKGTLVILFQFALALVLIVPTTVVLVRVQASLLPPDEHTVVPFDRSFGGAVEPLIVSGRGYTNMQDAYRTFSRASWRRLYVLYVKVYLAEIAISGVLMAIILPIAVLTSRKA